ncbi:MAG: DNA polymerase IV [Sphingopyxis sp.]|nr:DNA polymerase IV [Sphingopyxis sp.]
MDEASDPGAFSRKIIHVDMDAFFASVEQRDNPDLRGKPVAVGGSARRGVVAAASYEARRFGVRSAMPSVTAARQCPELIFVPPRFDAYKAVSQQIRAIFRDYADEVEPLSLDEAYLDVTADKAGLGSATAAAKAIRARIRAETGLTASAGVSYNKFIAKLASDQNKPDGLTVIRPDAGAAFVAGLSIRRFHGIGPVTAAKMEGLGIYSGADLAAHDLAWLAANFGNSAEWLYNLARGIDHRSVKSNRPLKSVGAERTFDTDLTDPADIVAALDHVAAVVWDRLSAKQRQGRTVTLKLRFADFTTITRAKTLGGQVADALTLRGTAFGLLEALLPLDQGIRLLGVTVSKFEGETEAEAGAANGADLFSLT